MVDAANECLNLPLFDETSVDDIDESVQKNEFGGIWTIQKLKYLSEYLKSFTSSFKNQSWANTIYIDTYAGTGSCDINSSNGRTKIDGSAKLALDIPTPFDKVIFIEKNSKKAEQLHNLKAGYPSLNIEIHTADSNQVLPKLLESKLNRQSRGVIFIDPFGMECEWAMLKEIATNTKLDVWYLFPLSGLYRQLPVRLSNLTEEKKQANNRILGTEAWINLYEKSPTIDYIDDVDANREKGINKITDFVTSRLEEIFPYVSEKPAILPVKGTPRYALYFAVSNDSVKAINLAKRISNQILNSAG